MRGEHRGMQEALFYGFSVERHVPGDHLTDLRMAFFAAGRRRMSGQRIATALEVAS